MTTNLSKDSDLPQSSATGPHSELITAAEQFASLYDGDDREYIKTDVLNSFYAGWDYARKAIAAQTAQAVPLDRFIAEHGHKLAIAFGIDYYDLADRDAQIKSRMDAAPPTQAIAEAWQPIETAPKDGTLVLAMVPWADGDNIELGHFDSDGDFWPRHRGHECVEPKGWTPVPKFAAPSQGAKQ